MNKVLQILYLIIGLNAQAQCWSKVTTGESHTIALKTDGTLWAWGENGFKQLGDGTNTNRNHPIQIGSANNWSKIDAGFATSFAIKTDGTLWAWGWNGHGELGDGTTTIKNTPTQIGTANDWSQISAGFEHTIGLKTDGTLWSWGWNNNGQLGDGTNGVGTDKFNPIQIGTASYWSEISAEYNHSFAIKMDGTLWAWGQNSSFSEPILGDGTNIDRNTPNQIGNSSNWSKINTGQYATFAIKTDGTLWAWGCNMAFGDGTFDLNYYDPVQIGSISNWMQISHYSSHVIALKTDGTLWTWGGNFDGALGNGTNADQYFPIQIGSTNDWVNIGSGFSFSMAIKTDGTLWGWGHNASGNIGDWTNIEKYVPTFISCSSLSFQENNIDNLFDIYPIPTSGIFKIENSALQIKEVEVLDILGKTVYSSFFSNQTFLEIDISSQPSGIYFIEVKSNKEKMVRKIIKE